ncbi:MAG TPA: SDR family oxidoreductase [Gemmataceae bacterium]|jgi:NAD(P)-dependent dehydrogenase (short-subunit alcohol dehydrogenase family)
MHPLHGKVALITGGSSGIGRATALRLASFGTRVAVAARTAETLDEVARQIKALGVEALTVPTDVTDVEQCRQAVEATIAQFGRLDVLLCSAGLSMRGMFADSEPAALERVMRVNFFGTLYPTYFAVPHAKRSHGSLVAISSLTGKRGTPSYAVYGASKFAVRGLYDSLRLELAGDGVHVGVVSPGFVATPLRERVVDARGRPWPVPPVPPFRIWPLEKCVDRVVRLIVKRRPHALLPAFVSPLLALDEITGGRLGDWYLGGKFNPADATPPLKDEGGRMKDELV